MEGSSLFLLQTNPNHPVVGVSSTSKASQILVTIQNSGVQLHEAFDQKVINSWPQKTGSRWTLPAMEIKQSGKSEARYMGVMDHNFVCTWTHRDPAIDTQKKGFKSKVVAVLTDKMIHEAVILVHEDGALRLCSHDLEKISSTLLPPGVPSGGDAHVVWAQAFGLQQSGVTFVLVMMAMPVPAAAENGATELAYVLHVHTLNPPPTHKKRKVAEEGGNVPALAEQEITWNVTHEIKRAGGTKLQPSVATTTFDFANLTHYILWSDGTAEVYRFSNLQHLLGKQQFSAPPFLQSSTKLNAFHIAQQQQQQQQQKNKSKQVVGRSDRELTGVASAPFQSFVALSGKRKDTGLPWLTLWDPIHGNLHDAREVSFEQAEDQVINPVTPDERVVQLAVSADASYVVVVLENHVAICPLYCPQPALGLLLDKMKSTLSFAEEEALPSFSSPIMLDVCVLEAERRQAAEQPAAVSAAASGGRKSATAVTGARTGGGDNSVDTIVEIKEELDVDRESEEIVEKKIELSPEIFLTTTSSSSSSSVDDWDRFMQAYEFEAPAIKSICTAPTKSVASVTFWRFMKPFTADQQNANATAGRVSHHFIRLVGDKCLRLGMWNELEVLIGLGQLSTYDIPDLVSTLLAQEQFGLLRRYIQSVHDIPTSVVVSLIDYFTRPHAHAEVLARAFFSANEKNKASGVSQDEAVKITCKRFLDVLVARRENFAFLLQYLKSFPLEQITYLLNYLTEWLEAHVAVSVSSRKAASKAASSKADNDDDNDVAPPVAAVLEWLSLLLDSRFSELVMLDDSHPIIERVRQVVDAELRVCVHIGQFGAYLRDYQRNLRNYKQLIHSNSASAVNSKLSDTKRVLLIETFYLPHSSA